VVVAIPVISNKKSALVLDLDKVALKTLDGGIVTMHPIPKILNPMRLSHIIAQSYIPMRATL
jgi:hypothetical protein